MMVAATWYVSALLVAVVATLAAAWGTWRNRDQAGAKPLVVVLVGATLWSGCTLATQVVSTPAVDLALNKLLYVGIVVVVNGYVLFALSFVGRGDLLSTRTLAVLAVEPGVLLGFLIHDPTGGDLIRETLVDGGVSTSGPLFLGHAVYSYVLIGVTTALLVRAAVQNRGLYMWQFSALLVGVAAPWISNALFLADVVPVDLTPIAFSVTGVVLFLAIQRAGLMDVAPVARDVVVDTIDTAMIVVDDQRRVVDFNTAFATHFGAVTIGESVASALSAYPEIRAAIDDDADGEIVAVSTPTGQRHLEVTVSPVTDHRGLTVGCVVLLHDVTEQQRQQRELKRQNEQLDQFASLVSHDLRNPLNVAVGRTELAQQTGDLSHLDDVQAAHDRMQRLIDDVLALARQGQTLDETAPVSLSTVATTAWHNVETAAATLEIDGDATIVADEGRLERLLENLFRNSVEHGSTGNRTESDDTVDHAGADVTVAVGVHDDGFYVEDDGPGIPEDEREAVFEAGYTDAADGTGFGLAIVEEIAQAHGWTVAATDSRRGGEDATGARFVFGGVERVTEQPPATATASDTS